MKRRSSLLLLILCLAIAASVQRELMTARVHAQETCDAAAGWLTATTPPPMSQPQPHPASDCPFYQAAWRQFLFATQPDQKGELRFLTSYKSLSDLFPTASVSPNIAKNSVSLLAMKTTVAPQTRTETSQSRPLLMLAPRSIQHPNDVSDTAQGGTNINAGVRQAGVAQGVLIDQSGNPIYYAIHVNPAFEQFLHDKGLTSADALKNATPTTNFDQAGIVEMKTAWQIVDSTHPPAGYFTTRADVPNLKIANGDLVADGSVREVTVALIAIHVAFTMQGHPEMIWSTFDHLSDEGRGVQDNAPSANGLPAEVPPGSVISNQRWNLYKAGTTVANANKPLSPGDLVLAFDEKSQSFVKNGITTQTSVYRYFPTSKTTRDPDTHSLQIDDAIVAVNASMQSIFQAAGGDDVRRNYQLVGAVWMDNPSKDFKENLVIANLPGQTTDTPGAMVAGEDGLSSVAMESFTQDIQPNCFSCHNTRAVRSDQTLKVIVGPKQLNVSHVLSKYLSTLQ